MRDRTGSPQIQLDSRRGGSGRQPIALGPRAQPDLRPAGRMKRGVRERRARQLLTPEAVTGHASTSSAVIVGFVARSRSRASLSGGRADVRKIPPSAARHLHLGLSEYESPIPPPRKATVTTGQPVRGSRRRDKRDGNRNASRLAHASAAERRDVEWSRWFRLEATAPLRMPALSIALSLIVVHCGSWFVAGEVNAEEQSPPETAGQRMLNREVVGRHRERGAAHLCGREPYQRRDPRRQDPGAGQSVGHRRDVDYLRDPATASMRAGSPTAGVYSRIRRSSANTSSPRTEELVSAAMSAAASLPEAPLRPVRVRRSRRRRRRRRRRRGLASARR